MPTCEECIFAEKRNTFLKGDVSYKRRIWCKRLKMLREGWEANYCNYFISKNSNNVEVQERDETCLSCAYATIKLQRASTSTVKVVYCNILKEIVSPKEAKVCPHFVKRMNV